MGLDYSYMLYFKKDLIWAALQSVVDISEPHQPPIIIRFPDHKLSVPLETLSETSLLQYDDPDFSISLYFPEDEAILDWRGEGGPPDESILTTVGGIELTIYTDLCEYAEEDETHDDILAIMRPISDLVLFNFGTTGTHMSILFQESNSIRTTFVELLKRVKGVCGVFNREDSGELFWLEGQMVSERIEAPYLLPGPRDDTRWEPEFVTPCKEVALKSRADAEMSEDHFEKLPGLQEKTRFERI